MQGRARWSPHESRKLKEHERNYATHDLKIAAIVHAFKMWIHYLMGRKFKIRIDHCGMKHLFAQPTLNSRQIRWLEFLSEYDFEIKHIKGKENQVVDALSVRAHEIHIVSIIIFKINMKDKIVVAANSNQQYLKIKETLQQRNSQQKFDYCEIKEDGILMYKGKVYVLNSDELKNAVMREMHNVSYVGQSEYQKTIATIKSKYFWPGMKKEVIDYIARCLECQKV
jgi:hypothetical protein